MVAHMKTTVEIADPLLRRVRALATREGTTLKALLEDALLALLRSRAERGTFVLRDASVDGNGIAAPFHEGDWDAIRSAAYEGRGG